MSNWLKQNWLAVGITLALGGLAGFLISTSIAPSIWDLKTFSYTFTNDDAYVARVNSLGLATFDGAWISVSGGKILNEINSVSISCWARTETCYIAQADILVEDKSFSNRISYYEIKDWTDSGQITATSSSLCEDQTLKADIKTNVVTLTESIRTDADEDFCVSSSEPIVLKLGTRGLRY